MFTEEDLQKGENSPVLGPHYFDSSRVAKNCMAKFEAEQFKSLIDKLTEEVNDRLWTALQSHLLIDTEINIQGDIWRMVDNCVKALLTGDKWALERYALSEKYSDGEKIRAAIAKHIPVELQDKRIADLEADIKRLTDDLKWCRNR